MRWDSPLVLALAGTAAVHLVLITAGDALVVTHPPRPWVPAPHVELIEIEVPPEIKPLPPPPAAAPQPPAPVEPVAPRPAPRAHAARAVASPPRAPEPPPPSPSEPQAPSGGEPVVQMDDVAPAATGVAVAVGKRVTGRIGRGGSGGGTGAGTGSGTGDEIARPVSVASIQVWPQAKGDYSYTGLGKEYPADAIALGIEGDIQVELTIDAHGKVTSCVLLTRLGHGLDEIALKRAKQMEFTPAIDTEGRVVSTHITWVFHMTLPK